jgi:transposase
MFYVGLDVSVGRTSVCIMDAIGQVVREQSVASTPEAITIAIRTTGMEAERVGLEAGINQPGSRRAAGRQAAGHRH